MTLRVGDVYWSRDGRLKIYLVSGEQMETHPFLRCLDSDIKNDGLCAMFHMINSDKLPEANVANGAVWCNSEDEYPSPTIICNLADLFDEYMKNE